MEELKNMHGEKLTFWKFYLYNAYNMIIKPHFSKYGEKINVYNFNDYMSEKMRALNTIIGIIFGYVLPLIVDFLAGYGVLSLFIKPYFNEDSLWMQLLLLLIVYLQAFIYFHIGLLISCAILYPRFKKRVKMNLFSDGELGLFKKIDKLLRKEDK